MNLNEILSAAGRNKRPKRVGRGTGSGHGKTSGRGHKGYGARSGAKKRLGYEGGQTPMLSRIPKRGFNNANFRKEYQVVNVAVLEEKFENGERVDVEALVAANIINDLVMPLKVLGDGKIDKKLTVVASKFSASAREKITKAGGTVEEV